MTPSAWTALLLFAVIHLVGLYDVVIGLLYGYDATVSAVIQNASMKWPILPLATGIVLGHFFWPVSANIVIKLPAP